MRTIAQWTSDYIKQAPFLYEQLMAGTLNISALARRMKPEIEAGLSKSVSVGALVMAVKRYVEKSSKQRVLAPQAWSDLTVRPNIVEFAFTNSPAFISVRDKLIALKKTQPDTYLNILEGIFETTIIASQSLAPSIRRLTKDEHSLIVMDDVSMISLRFKPESVYTHSVYARILDALSWEGINIVEVMSVYTELILLFKQEDVKNAFRVIESLAENASSRALTKKCANLFQYAHRHRPLQRRPIS